MLSDNLEAKKYGNNQALIPLPNLNMIDKNNFDDKISIPKTLVQKELEDGLKKDVNEVERTVVRSKYKLPTIQIGNMNMNKT